MYTNIFKINYKTKLIHIFISFKTTFILATISSFNMGGFRGTSLCTLKYGLVIFVKNVRLKLKV